MRGYTGLLCGYATVLLGATASADVLIVGKGQPEGGMLYAQQVLRSSGRIKGKIDTVQISQDYRGSSVTLDQLQAYDVVVVISMPYEYTVDRGLFWNALAQYVDGGGNVVEVGILGGECEYGAWQTSNYSCFAWQGSCNYYNYCSSREYTADVPDHPILDGVANMNGRSENDCGCFYGGEVAADGVTTIATFDAGGILAMERNDKAGRIVCIGTVLIAQNYFCYGWSDTSGIYRMLVNATVYAANYIDLSLQADTDDLDINVGGSANVSLTLENLDDNATAEKVVVQVDWPTQFAFVDSDGDGEFDPRTSQWKIDALQPGDTVSIEIEARVTAPGMPTLTAVASFDGIDDDETNNSAMLRFNIQQADLQIRATPPVGPASRSEPAVVAFTVDNTGPDDASGVVVSLPIPAGLQLESSLPSPGSFDPTTGTWTVGRIDEGSRATISLTLVPTASVPDSVVARVRDVDQFDANTLNNEASVNVAPQLVDLAVTGHAPISVAAPGTTMSLTFTLENLGDQDATAVMVDLPIDDAVELITSEPSQGTFADGVWDVGTLAAGDEATLTLSIKIAEPSLVTFQATISSIDQLDASNNNNSAQVPVLALPSWNGTTDAVADSSDSDSTLDADTVADSTPTTSCSAGAGLLTPLAIGLLGVLHRRRR